MSSKYSKTSSQQEFMSILTCLTTPTGSASKRKAVCYNLSTISNPSTPLPSATQESHHQPIKLSRPWQDECVTPCSTCSSAMTTAHLTSHREISPPFSPLSALSPPVATQYSSAR